MEPLPGAAGPECRGQSAGSQAAAVGARPTALPSLEVCELGHVRQPLCAFSSHFSLKSEDNGNFDELI